jgi:hypothetical protein
MVILVFHGCRFIARSQLPTIPYGGVDATNTPAGAFRVTPTGALLRDLGDE